MVDDGQDWRGFNTFIRQQGKEFFDDEALGFEREDLVEYWQMWEELRAAGALPPQALMQEYTDHWVTPTRCWCAVSPPCTCSPATSTSSTKNT